MTKKKYKVGIIGYGYMGEIRRRVIEEHPLLSLVGIMETNQTIRAKIKKCKAWASTGELFQTGVDIVFVCTPNAFSPELCCESLRRGKHVFCEKPPGRSVKDIQSIMAAEQQSSAKLMFGFNHRFHPGVIKAKVIVESKRLGNIIGLQGVYGKSGGMHFRSSWRNDKKISGGGILLDQGIHMLDLFRYFCGDFELVKCCRTNSFWKFDVEDNAFVLLQNKQGQIASLHSSSTLWKHTFYLQILLEQGYVIVEGLLSKTGSYGREKVIVGKRQFEDETAALGNPEEEITYFDRDLSWTTEVDEFISCIQENKKIAMSSSFDALKVMEIIEKAYQDAPLDSDRKGAPNEK